MTAGNLAAYIGCTANLAVGELIIAVEILDARKVWNRTDYLVRPIAGSGQQWVSADRTVDVMARTA